MAELRLAFHAMPSAHRFHEPFLARNRALATLLEDGEYGRAESELTTYLDDALLSLLPLLSRLVAPRDRRHPLQPVRVPLRTLAALRDGDAQRDQQRHHHEDGQPLPQQPRVPRRPLREAVTAAVDEVEHGGAVGVHAFSPSRSRRAPRMSSRASSR